MAVVRTGFKAAPRGLDEDQARPVEPPQNTVSGHRSPIRERARTSFGILVCAALVLLTALSFETARLWLLEHWQLPTIVLAAIVLWPLFEHWFGRVQAVQRAAIVTFLVIPAIVAFVLTFVVLEPSFQVPLVRTVFLSVVCLLPGTLYFLFIATRRDSLLSEFLTNLVQLGLTGHRCVPAGPDCLPRVEDGTQAPGNPVARESEIDRRRRVRTYLERFEAKYGQLSDELIDDLVVHTDPNRDDRSAQQPGAPRFQWSKLLTAGTTIPVIVATALIALGWLLTLPPQDLTAQAEQKVRSEVTEQQAAAADGGAAPLAGLNPTGQAVAATGEEAGGQSVSEADLLAVVPEAGPAPTMTPEQNYAISKLRNALQPPDFQAVHFAFLGAYFFSLQMLFRRYVRRDLGPRAYVGVALRIILSVIGVWFAFQIYQMFDPDIEMSSSGFMVLAFAIGAFPQIVWQLMKAGIAKLPFVATLPSVHSTLPTGDLDGITIWHQARLEEEDIENIPNMATADMVELMLHTRVPPDRIIDWVDQAILYTQLGSSEDGREARDLLRRHGVRTASGLIEAYRCAHRRNDLDAFEALLGNDAPRSRMRTLVDTLKTNPNLPLIYNWRGLAAPAAG